MSLSTWEQEVLDSIKKGLASSDPTLVARLAIFTRLASGEEMPAWERIRAGSRHSRPRPRPPHRDEMRRGAGWLYRHLGLQRAMVLLWLVITVAMIAVALAYNRDGSHGACTKSWTMLCTDAAPASSGSAPGIP